MARLNTPFPPFDEIEDEIALVIDLVMDLHRWWDRSGSDLFRGDGQFRWHLQAVGRLTEQRNLKSLVAGADRHLQQNP
ncbi:MAG: hypothetical protein ACYCTI_00305 [Acidimicrobiales bacterium]